MTVLAWLNDELDRWSASEHLFTAIFAALRKQGYRTRVLQKDTGGPLPHLNEEMVENDVTTTLIPFKKPKKSDLVMRYFADLSYTARCTRVLKKMKDVSAVYLQSSYVAGYQVRCVRRCLPGVPVIFNVQDIFPENAVLNGTLPGKGIAFKGLSATQRYAYRHADRLITISEDMKDTLVGLGADEEKIDVVYNWSYQDEPYNLSHIDYGPVEPLYQKDQFNVVYAGNIGRVQNVDLILKAANLLRDDRGIQFHIIGDGVFKKRLMNDARKMNLPNVTFSPRMDASCAPAIYAGADVNIIPLKKDIYKTALPSKTATCLACRKPIIFCLGKDSSFARKAHEETNAYNLDTDDAEGLAAAIVEIRDEKPPYDSSDFFRRHFRKTVNAKKYADIIIRSFADRQDP